MFSLLDALAFSVQFRKFGGGQFLESNASKALILWRCEILLTFVLLQLYEK